MKDICFFTGHRDAPQTGLSALKTLGKLLLYLVLPAYLLFLGVLLFRTLSFRHALLNAPEPEQCAVCQASTDDFIWLVNLSTGQTGELRRPDGGGTFSPSRCAGLTVWVEGGRETCAYYLSVPTAPMIPARFCRSCRIALAAHAREGAVLLYPGDASVLPLRDGANGVMASRAVSVEQSGRDHYCIKLK